MTMAAVFSGGSTKAPLHVGAVQAMEEAHLPLKYFYGNSAGSIIAACLAIGYDFLALYKLALQMDFKKLLKGSKFLGIIRNNYINDGKAILDFYHGIYGDKTFRSANHNLYIVGHSLAERSYKIFSKETTPDLEIYKAVRASSSVPMLFQPYEINGELFTDGGMSCDFPVDHVPTYTKYVGHLIQSPANVLKWDTPIEYGLAIIDQIIQSNVESSIKRAHKNGIIIRTQFELPITKFDIDFADKEVMVELGYKTVKDNLTW